jgi:hypothetical protein
VGHVLKLMHYRNLSAKDRRQVFAKTKRDVYAFIIQTETCGI